MEKLKNFLEQENKRTFIDIGTGVGNFINLIKHVYDGFDSIIGIDYFERAIEAANKNNKDKRIEFKLMDAYGMEYEDNSFDVVMLSNSLHHLEDIDKMLEVMKRVVKPDGFILISEMISNNLDKRQISHKMIHHFSAVLDTLKGEIHHETFTDEEIVNHLTKSNILTVKDKWFLDMPKQKANTKEEIDYLLNILDRVSSRIPEGRDDLQEEKENIKNYIVENGYDNCPTLLTVLTK